MKIEIQTTCPDCDGHGKTESTVGGWTASGPWMKYVTHECHHCNGTGNESVVVDDYDTLEEAQMDYPKSKMQAA